MGRRGRSVGPYRLGEDDEDARLSPAAQAARQELAELEGDPRVRAAALVADTFGLDPILVLEERDPFKRLLRLAAHNLLQTERDKAAKRQAT